MGHGRFKPMFLIPTSLLEKDWNKHKADRSLAGVARAVDIESAVGTLPWEECG